MTQLRAAVIGVGNMGQHHARIYDTLPGVDLVAICDTDFDRLNEVGNRHGRAKRFTSPDILLGAGEFDLLSIAVPTHRHYDIALRAIMAGRHVLVEKPLAMDAAGALHLVDMAHNKNVILATGHIERANPIVQAIKWHIKDGQLGTIHRISTRRVGPDIEGERDTGATLDLAVHDLDVMRYLLGVEPMAYQAEISTTGRHGDLEDSVSAILTFPGGGAMGVLECDWLSPIKLRDIVVYGKDALIIADYQSKTGVIYRQDGTGYALTMPKREPLLTEIEAFVRAVQGEGEPLATGHDGLVAVRMAEGVRRAATK